MSKQSLSSAQGSARFWLSEDIQAFLSWVDAVQLIRSKSPLEMASMQAKLDSSSGNNERKAVFGDGRQDYMMQRYKNLALISISGTLVKSDAWYNRYYGLVSYDEIRRSTLIALQDRSVDGILMVMNTPGGAAAGADSMAAFFGKADKNKPLYAYAESDMCSGGYYLGAPAREIFAQRAAMIGSIGVVMVHYDILKMYQEAGIKPTVFRSGEFKALGSQVEHLNEKSRASIQKTLDDYFAMFNEHVVDCRNFPSVEEMRATAGEGRVFMAEEAKDVNLVDQVAELEETLDICSNKAAKIAGRSYQFPVSSTNNMQAKKGDDMPRSTREAFSEEQLAALSAGASLESLAVAGAQQAPAGGEGGEGAPEAKAPEAGAPEAKAPEAGAPEAKAPEAGAPEAKAPEATPEAKAADVDKIIELSTQIGELKVQLQAAQADSAKLKAEADGKDAMIENLRSVAVIAINNRQVALGYQPSDASAMSAQQCFELFGKLDADFKERFQPGAKAQATREEVKAATLSPKADAARRMTGNL